MKCESCGQDHEELHETKDGQLCNECLNSDG